MMGASPHLGKLKPTYAGMFSWRQTNVTVLPFSAALEGWHNCTHPSAIT